MQHPRDVAKEGGRPEVTNAAGVEPDAARAELARILASAEFDASERNRRFLSYIVEQTLGGRGDRIKAYDIAVTVFGRDDGFDPQIDPIVRIEASRLRRSLDHYYLLAGRDDPIRIEIPKGGYVPVFHQAMMQYSRVWSRRPHPWSDPTSHRAASNDAFASRSPERCSSAWPS